MVYVLTSTIFATAQMALDVGSNVTHFESITLTHNGCLMPETHVGFIINIIPKLPTAQRGNPTVTNEL